MELAAVRGAFLRQQQIDLIQAFVKAGAQLVRRYPEAAKLMRQERARETDLDAPARDCVEHGDLAGKLERVVEHGQYGTGHKAHRLGALRQRGEKHNRIGAVSAISFEIVLHRPSVGEAQGLGLFGDREAIGEIAGGIALTRAQGGKELNSELH